MRKIQKAKVNGATLQEPGGGSASLGIACLPSPERLYSRPSVDGVSHNLTYNFITDKHLLDLANLNCNSRLGQRHFPRRNRSTIALS
jgi:hypothetical protein